MRLVRQSGVLGWGRRFSSTSSFPQYLLNVPETRITTTSNGIRVASQKLPGQTATVGVWIDTGSVYETAQNNGVAHFSEHLAFKGTEKRTQQGLEVEVENMGARLNAYTSREQTVYYANCFKGDTPKALEILSDILQNPKIDENAVEYERSVILREMQEIESQEEELIMDHLHAVAYQGHPLGYTILGPKENIETITRKNIQEYIRTHYTAGRMVVSAAGDIDHDALHRQVESSFARIPSKDIVSPSSLPRSQYTGTQIEIRDDSKPLCHVAFATESVGWTDPRYFVFTVLQTLIGQWSRTDGTGRNSLSRLTELLATEQLAHSLSAFHTPYRDTGLFGSYLVAASDKIEDASFETLNEWVRIAQSVTDKEVRRAVSRLKGQLLMQLDGTFAVAEDTGRQLLTLGRRMPLAELFARLDAIDAKAVQSVAAEFLVNCELSVAALGPIENLPDCQQLQAWTKWNRV